MVMDTSSYRSMVQKSAAVAPEAAAAPGGGDRLPDLPGRRPAGGWISAGSSIKIGKDPTSRDRREGLVGRLDGGHHQPPPGRLLPQLRRRHGPSPGSTAEPVQKSVLLQDLDVIEVGPVKLQFFLKSPGRPPREPGAARRVPEARRAPLSVRYSFTRST
ncbi:MAG: hypothetical protein MZV70_00125 [Desulfobacterales bacterium]|nr:hypothetical protein [Desulfobacterales bacterium]